MIRKILSLLAVVGLLVAVGCVKVGGSKSNEPQVQGQSGNTSVEINK